MGAPRITDLSGMSRNAGASGSSTDAQTRPLTARGEVAIAPTSESDKMVVLVTSLTRQFGVDVPAGNWEPKGVTLPQPGAPCLVVFDDLGDAFVPLWGGGATGGLHELGDIIASGATSRPLCLLCDGTAYTLTAHPTLGAVAEACPQYVSGGVFTTPNLSGATLVGADPSGVHLPVLRPALGASGGEETHTLTSAESGVNGNGVTGGMNRNDPHAHTNLVNEGSPAFDWSSLTPGPNPAGHPAGLTDSTSVAHEHALVARNADAAHNNVQPYHAVNWFIYTGA